MVARARARDAKRHERREQTAVDRSRKLAASLSESNATNEALRSMVREITQKHVAALAALGVAEEKAETALLSAQKLKPARASPRTRNPEAEPEHRSRRRRSCASRRRGRTRATTCTPRASRPRRRARRGTRGPRGPRRGAQEALGPRGRFSGCGCGTRDGASSQRNPDGLGVDELTKRVDEARSGVGRRRRKAGGR